VTSSGSVRQSAESAATAAPRVTTSRLFVAADPLSIAVAAAVRVKEWNAATATSKMRLNSTVEVSPAAPICMKGNTMHTRVRGDDVGRRERERDETRRRIERDDEARGASFQSTARLVEERENKTHHRPDASSSEVTNASRGITFPKGRSAASVVESAVRRSGEVV